MWYGIFVKKCQFQTAIMDFLDICEYFQTINQRTVFIFRFLWLMSLLYRIKKRTKKFSINNQKIFLVRSRDHISIGFSLTRDTLKITWLHNLFHTPRRSGTTSRYCLFPGIFHWVKFIQGMCDESSCFPNKYFSTTSANEFTDTT